MMSRSTYIYAFSAMLLLVAMFYACEDEQGTPEFEIEKISRLYVSFEEFGTTDARADTNLRVIQSADSTAFVFRESHVSQVPGGGAIYYTPFLKKIFQASVNSTGADTLIGAVDQERTGDMNNAGEGLRSRYYSDVKGFVYHAPMQTLMVVNGAGSNAGIYLVDNPGSAGADKQPYKKLVNPDLNMWGAAYRSDRLFTSKLSAPAGLYMFENLTTRRVSAADSTAHLAPTRTLRIEGATENLRGLCYDTVKNVMAIAEMGTGGAGSGKILLFDNFSGQVNAASEVIRPSRIITGANTGLIEPVDVAIDMRASGVYMYVADRGAKKVLRFKYTDEGNVAPESEIETAELLYGVTPVGLALDARDISNVPSIR